MSKQKLQREIKSITKQLIEKYKPEKIILFGSAVWGKYDKDSDLDFLIIKKNTPYYGIDRMREVDRFVKTSFPCDFLVVKPEEIKTRIKLGDPFVKLILEKGKVLHG